MIDASKWIRPDILEMAPYQPIVPFDVLSEQLGRDPQDIVKLDANENPYGPPEAVRQALADLEFIHIYPDPESRQIRRALSRAYNLPLEHLMVGAGADELIDLIMRLILAPGDALLSCPPTFGMYSFDGALNQASLIEVPRRSDFRPDLAAVATAVEAERPKVLFLANPNNPDGSLLTPEELERVLALPLLVVLDEAYVEFAKPGSSLLNRVPERENLIVLRTFSKWAGLAGLRLGFGAFPLALIEQLWKIKQPYNVSVAASQAGLAALAHRDQLAEVGQRIQADRNRLMQQLGEISYLEPYPSEANFILCRVLDRPAADLTQALMDHGILIRYFDKPGLSDHIRITVGRQADTDRLIQLLKGWQ